MFNFYLLVFIIIVIKMILSENIRIQKIGLCTKNCFSIFSVKYYLHIWDF